MRTRRSSFGEVRPPSAARARVDEGTPSVPAIAYPKGADNLRNVDPGAHAVFATTRWSLVRAAGAGGSPEAEAALETLCRSYWPPIYGFIRRFGHDRTSAEDLSQDFFQRLLSRNYPGQADPRKGRFRSFLLIALNHFLLDERERSRAQKRGGGREFVSFDAATEEARLALEPTDELTPEVAFERSWARMVLEEAERRLAVEFTGGKDGHALRWEVLRRFLPGEQPELPGGEAALQLGIPENTLKSHVHRLRRRHGEIVRLVIAETVATPAEVDAELRHLISVLAGS